MAESKLPLLLRLARDEEQARAQELAALRSLRVDAENQAASLEDMLRQYREDRLQASATDADRLANFQRFYGAVRDSLGGHDVHLKRLIEDEQRGEDAWQAAYRKRKAISRLTERRAEQARRLAAKKAARAGVFRRWTMLNRQDQEQDM